VVETEENGGADGNGGPKPDPDGSDALIDGDGATGGDPGDPDSEDVGPLH
jgi:hypothetical protein